MRLTIQARVADLQEAIDYFLQLGYEVRKRDDEQAIAADKGVIIELTSKPKDRTALKFYSSQIRTSKGDVFLDPDGNKIIHSPEDSAPARSTMTSVLGNSMGIGLECFDLQKSADFYTSLGLRTLQGSVTQGWLTLGVEQEPMLSLMSLGACPHLFLNPSISYFNGGENVAIIDELRLRSVPLAEELTVFNQTGEVDNVILIAPGQVGVFVFND